MTRRLETYLADVERNLMHLAPDERDGVLREMRSHLQDEIAEHRQNDPALTEDEATERALRAFGDPRELGVSFQGTPRVVNRQTGHVLLELVHITGRAARATGRGIGLTLKWIAIIVLTIILVSVTTALTLVIIFQDDIREATPRPMYSYEREFTGHTGTDQGAFTVNEDLKELRIMIDVRRTSGGCATIQVINPDGDTAFDNTGNCGDLSTLLTFTQPGTWQVRYTYADFRGHTDVNAFAFERA